MHYSSYDVQYSACVSVGAGGYQDTIKTPLRHQRNNRAIDAAYQSLVID